MAPSPVSNIEVKARAVLETDELRRRLQAAGAERAWQRRQVDAFYATPQGRLKLRREYEGPQEVNSELIAYLRADCPELRTSSFVVVPVPDPATLDRLLGDMLGHRAVVRKCRELWLLHEGTVRVHLDEVEGLGRFVEIEAIVATGSAPSVDDGLAALQRRRAEELLAALAIDHADHVAGAYADMLGQG